jgi:hypothetical protein
MTGLQLYGLIAPVILLAVCGALGWWSHNQANRSNWPAQDHSAHPAE